MLKKMIDAQADFQKNFFDVDSLTREERIKWTKEFVLCTHQELAEVLDSLDWKTYHLYGKDYSDENMKVEIIDVLKFVLNLCVVWKISAEEVEAIFDEKTKQTITRFKEKQSEKDNKEMVRN